jgi:hypothetical protein
VVSLPSIAEMSVELRLVTFTPATGSWVTLSISTPLMNAGFARMVPRSAFGAQVTAPPAVGST